MPREIEELASGRERRWWTSPWHERDTRSLAERLDARVFTPPPDEGSPEVAWLLGEPRSGAHLYSAGDRLPVGVEAFPGRLPNDVVLWMESPRAVIVGDTLVDFGRGLEIPVEWLPQDVTREQVADGLEPLLTRRSSSCSRHTAGRPTEPPSSVRSPDDCARSRDGREQVGASRGSCLAFTSERVGASELGCRW